MGVIAGRLFHDAAVCDLDFEPAKRQNFTMFLEDVKRWKA
jgi:hypothetical protein